MVPRVGSQPVKPSRLRPGKPVWSVTIHLTQELITIGERLKERSGRQRNRVLNSGGGYMVGLMVYGSHSFLQPELPLDLLVEQSGPHLNSLSRSMLLQSDSPATAFHEIFLTDIAPFPSIITRVRLSRSPPGQHRSSSFPIPKPAARELHYVSAYHIFLHLYPLVIHTFNSLWQILQSDEIDTTGATRRTTTCRENAGGNIGEPGRLNPYWNRDRSQIPRVQPSAGHELSHWECQPRPPSSQGTGGSARVLG